MAGKTDIQDSAGSDGWKKAERIIDARALSEIGAFTVPCLMELVLFSLISVANLAMVGRLGAGAMSAVGLSVQPVNMIIALFVSFNIGATALISRSTGAGDYSTAKKVIFQTLSLTSLMALGISVPSFFFAEGIVTAMGGEADVIPEATVYLKFMAAGTLFQVIPLAVSSLLRGAGDSRSPMIINIMANLINLGAGFVLIFGRFGFPPLGVTGAALAATTAKLVSAVLALLTLFLTPLPIRISVKEIDLRLDREIILRIGRIGMISAIEQLILRFGFFLYTRTIAQLGTASFAAHQVLLSISNLSTNFGHALGMASTSFTGRYLGAEKAERAEAYVKTLFTLAVAISLGVSVLFLLKGYELARIFTSDAEVINLLVPVLITLAVINPAQNSLLVYSGSLKGAGDTKRVLIITVSGLLLVRLPLVFLLIKGVGMGLNGAWIAAALEKYLMLLLFYIYFSRGKWRNTRV